MGLNIRDAALQVTKALPNGAASIQTDPIDLGNGPRGDFVANCELVIEAPALAVGDLANDDTMTYIVEMDDNAGFSTPTTVINAIVQLGAGGAGAAAQTKRFRLPLDVERYIRVKVTNSDSGDASDKSVTARLEL